ncbi:hypothetical protein B0J17DRAFT_631477 [Rhizoctonia solani]|nr:hypothetical protein B0J17DRAFT_631477 [Rhizoctonia solani]
MSIWATQSRNEPAEPNWEFNTNLNRKIHVPAPVLASSHCDGSGTARSCRWEIEWRSLPLDACYYPRGQTKYNAPRSTKAEKANQCAIFVTPTHKLLLRQRTVFQGDEVIWFSFSGIASARGHCGACHDGNGGKSDWGVPRLHNHMRHLRDASQPVRYRSRFPLTVFIYNQSIVGKCQKRILSSVQNFVDGFEPVWVVRVNEGPTERMLGVFSCELQFLSMEQASLVCSVVWWKENRYKLSTLHDDMTSNYNFETI